MYWASAIFDRGSNITILTFFCVLFSLECWPHITVFIYISQTCNRIFRPILFSNFIIYSYLCLWWVGRGQLPDPHPDAPSLPLLNRTGGQNKMETLMGQDKDRQITEQFLSQVKQTFDLGKLIYCQLEIG